MDLRSQLAEYAPRSATFLRVSLQALSCNFTQVLWNRFGHGNRFRFAGRQLWFVLRQDGNQRSAKRPNVGGGRRPSGRDLRRVVRAGRASVLALTHLAQSVRGNLQPVAGRHDVRRLDAPVHKASLVQGSEGLRRGPQHLGSLIHRERAQRKNLRQIFFGIFHNDVKQPRVVDLAAAVFKQLDQMGTRKSCRGRPTGKLSGFVHVFLALALRGNELDGGLLQSTAPLGEKYGAVIRASQPLSQRELSIDYPASPFFPDCGWCAHRPRLGEPLFYSSTSPGAP